MKPMKRENSTHRFRLVFALTCMLALTLNACDGGAKKPATTDGAPAASAQAAQVPSSDEDIDKADIPVPEDFDEEAASKITDENLDEEIARLEAEIDGDKE